MPNRVLRILLILALVATAACDRGKIPLQSDAEALPQHVDSIQEVENLLRLGEVEQAVFVAREVVFAQSPESQESDNARILLCHARAMHPEIGPAPSQEGDGSSFGPEYITGDVQKPEKIHEEDPVLTKKARRERVQGVVTLQTIIDQEGCLTDIKVLKGLPHGLSEAAVDAVKRWVYRPATLNGKPVAIYFNLTFQFNLQ